LTIFIHSGAVSNSIRALAKQLITDEIIGSYGTSEIGVICTIADDGIGTIFPAFRLKW
jgi:hypothetical protein